MWTESRHFLNRECELETGKRHVLSRVAIRNSNLYQCGCSQLTDLLDKVLLFIVKLGVILAISLKIRQKGYQLILVLE